MKLTRKHAEQIANDFFKDMNPTFWNGQGDKPSTFDERIWECELSEYDDLNISLYYDDIEEEWVHCCEIVDKQSNEMIEILTGYGIDSYLNLVDTILDICNTYD